MKKAKKFLYPPRWVRYTVPPVSFGALWYLFATENTERVLAYPIYCMSAYALVILLAAVPSLAKRCKSAVQNSWLMQKAISTAFGRKYLTDLSFRGNFSIWQGMAVNFFYVLFRIVTGIRYASLWFLSMAVYYLVLGSLRAYLVYGYRKPDAEKRQCYRRTAWLLFLLNIPMGGMILQMVITNSGFFYPEYVIYLSAMYTFYTMILSVVHLVKFRKLGDPVLSAAKVLNFVSAMMSVLGLQTAMIARFSEQGESYRKQMNLITGSIIYGVVIGIAIYMLLHSRKQQRVCDLCRGENAMNKSESKYFHTAEKMDKAFLELLEKKDFAYITVKEICEKAGVHRSTFYLHYETIGDLLEESKSYMNEQFLQYMQHDTQNFIQKIHTCSLEELYLIKPKYLKPYLQFIQEHKQLFQTTTANATALRLDDTYAKMFHHVFMPILERYGVPEAERTYLLTFYISGIMALVNQWLRSDCADPVEQIVALIQRCIPQRNDRQEKS